MTRAADRQRGAVLILALIVLTTMVALGGLSMLNVQSELASSGGNRFNQTAVYAAESGVQMAAVYLRMQCTDSNGFQALIELIKASGGVLCPGPGIIDHPVIFGNNRQAKAAGNPFLLYPKNEMWYRVCITNNVGDPGGENDSDGMLTVRSTGYGVGKSSFEIEADIGIDFSPPGWVAPNVFPDCTGLPEPRLMRTYAWRQRL